MDLQGYFEPSTVHTYFPAQDAHGLFASVVAVSKADKPLADLSGYDLAIIGIPDGNCSQGSEMRALPDQIRKKLYGLASPGSRKKIADLGNFIAGKTLEDTFIGLRDVLLQLIEKNIIPLLLGGSNLMAYPCYLAYEKLKRNASITSISPFIEFNNDSEGLKKSFMEKIIEFKGEHLFNFSAIGYQSCLVRSADLKILDKMYFDAYRLGVVRSGLKDTEPIMRDTDLLIFDINAIKQSDAPGSTRPTPNGFYSDEACQLSRYAGISDKLSCMGIFELCPPSDLNEQTISLAAQLVWYFIDGLNHRKKEFPRNKPGNFTKYIVTVEGKGEDLVFYKSHISSRWWMEVPSTKYSQQVIIACTYDDYTRASAGELPDRWWRTYQKIN